MTDFEGSIERGKERSEFRPLTRGSFDKCASLFFRNIPYISDDLGLRAYVGNKENFNNRRQEMGLRGRS